MPNQEQIVETKICRHCTTSFDITDVDMAFYDKISPTIGGTKHAVPTPTLCPDCRQQRRLSFRNERHLYKRKCDASGKDIISIYSPDKPYKVYDQKIRRSDAWDAMDYGREFDFDRTFTEQFGELMKEVPKIALMNKNCENSNYAPYCIGLANCYLCISGSNSQECLYGYHLTNDTRCIDICNVFESECVYECIDCKLCTFSSHLHYCESCSFCVNCYGCMNCQYCINCTNITGGRYMIDNKQSTKEEYEKQLGIVSKKYISGTCDNSFIFMMSENVSGRNIKESKNIYKGYNINSSEDCRYMYTGTRCDTSIDCSNSVTKNSIEVISSVDSMYTGFNEYCRASQYIYYSSYCFDSTNLFGCIGLRNKSYCIFNKQYTKEKYEKLVAKIIMYMTTTGERGEFFHPSLSPFGYNETVAMEYFRATWDTNPSSIPSFVKEGGDKRSLFDYGFHRSTYIAPTPIVDQVIHGADLPSSIQDVDDSILKVAIRCEVSDKLFRIIPQELAFYRKHSIPLPRRHPDQRHADRMKLRMRD